jgi:outer membrane protein assembly factor BamE (lipoprotein component of BamABCDE complex)
MTLNKTSNLIICALTLAITGCSVEPYNQGNYVDISVLKGKEGVWHRVDVENTIGSPSFEDPKSKNVVYYVGARGVKYPFLSPSLEKTSTIRIEYDSRGKLVMVSAIE